MSKCRYCGYENDNDARACAACSMPIIELQMSNEPQNNIVVNNDTEADYRELRANPRLVEEAFCKICSRSFEVGDDVVQCTNCSTYYHKSCYEGNKGCNQPSCSEATKECPFCRNRIKESALKCKFCGRYLDRDIYPTEIISRGTHPEAKNALIFGIISIFCCAVVFGPMAIVKGSDAIRDIENNPGYEGLGMAKAGRILGIIGLVLWVLIIIGRASRYASLR
ncbi:MAG TPA: DUF4190 domain-containing protein [Clostridia bacterium]